MPRKARPKISLAEAQAKVEAQKQKNAARKAKKIADAASEAPESPQERPEECLRTDSSPRKGKVTQADVIASGLLDVITCQTFDFNRLRANPRDVEREKLSSPKPPPSPYLPCGRFRGDKHLRNSYTYQWWQDRNQEEFQAQQAGKGENTVLDQDWYSEPNPACRDCLYMPGYFDVVANIEGARDPETGEIDWSLGAFSPGARNFFLDAGVETMGNCKWKLGHYLLELTEEEQQQVIHERNTLGPDITTTNSPRTHSEQGEFAPVKLDKSKPWGPENFDLRRADSVLAEDPRVGGDVGNASGFGGP